MITGYHALILMRLSWLNIRFSISLFFLFLDEELKEPVNEAVEPEREEIRQMPYSLPEGFVWDTLDLEDPDVVRSHNVFINLNRGCVAHWDTEEVS